MRANRKDIKKKEVIKHSAAIQISSNITLLQRRAWNVLLAHAYNELPIKEMHDIRIIDLIESLDFDSKNESYLKDIIRALVRCVVEWNILNKDGKLEWGIAGLLAGARIVDGICTYSYEPMLRERLYNPHMYARLSLTLQNRFKSKHAHVLWEICTDYLGVERGYGETPFILLEKFKKLMGLSASGEYAQFKIFNRDVIKPAVAEINLISDLRVEAEYQRSSRKITAIKFKIRRVKIPPAAIRKQPDLFPDLQDMPILVKELKDAGLSTQDALEIWQQGFQFVEEAARPTPSGEEADMAFTRYVREKIHLLKRRLAAGKVDNSTGFLREALKKNYANPEFTAEETARAAARRHTQQERAARLAQLKDQLVAVQRAWDTALGTALSILADTMPQVVEEAVTTTLAATPFLRNLCPAGGSALDKYRASLALRSVVNPLLTPYAPEQVHMLEAQYAPQIAALEAQIAALA